ncbi:large subunit GTPase 1 [Monosporozyma unispora]|nr:large subunit GTPase 1 [Kazachstania unispora]
MPPKERPQPKKWKPPKGPKPTQRKNKNTIGLGKAIQSARKQENSIEYLPDGEMRFTTEKHEANWVKLRSVTQESALDEFLSTAELANKDFTADRHSNVKIIRMDSNTDARTQAVGMTNAQKELLNAKQREHAKDLIVPRRPYWDEFTTKYELQRQEGEAFLEWRRKLAELQESNEDLLLTPFERNIEVWKQLWRVVERSDLVVQIVDARDPLLFRSVDLERYVKELDERKANLLLVNKADLLTRKQRIVWAKYFVSKGISFTFYSALRANQLLEMENEDAELDKDEIVTIDDEITEGENIDDEIKEKITILSIDELEDLFLSKAPAQPLTEPLPGKEPILQIGLVGYPNVGKSSTINSLVGAKKVSVSSTPGKTKHFQTIMLSDSVMLCDCPGLVFPNFAYNKGELVCNGVLPIDQLRDFVGPSNLVAQRVPKYYLEAVYGIHIQTRTKDEGGDGVTPTGQELLVSYARARGYMTQGFGSADESRASRYILKDYVNGKLLYINPPPHIEDDTPYSIEECKDFNKDLYTFERLPESRKEQIREAAKNKGIEVIDLSRDLNKLTFSAHTGGNDNKEAKSVTHGGKQAALYNAAEDLDNEFFKMNSVEGRLTNPFHKQMGGAAGSKKHNKKNKKGKKKAAMMAD